MVDPEHLRSRGLHGRVGAPSEGIDTLEKSSGVGVSCDLDMSDTGECVCHDD